MSTVNLIDRSSPSADLKTGLLKASATILYGFMIDSGRCLIHTDYSAGITKFRSWSVFCQNHLYPHSASSLVRIRIDDIEPYTFTNEAESPSNHILGDYLILDNDMTLAEFDSTDNDYVITDALASAFDAMFNKNVSKAYACLSYVNTIVGLIKERTAGDKDHTGIVDIDIETETLNEE